MLMKETYLSGCCRIPSSQRLSLPRTARGRLVVSNSGLPTADAVKPITYDDMLNHLVKGCKPRSAWKIGTEHEKLGYDLKTYRRPTYEQINQIFNALEARFGWTPIIEGGNAIGVKAPGQSVTLEPGGQFELSGAPLANLHLTAREVHSHLFEATTIAKDLGLGFNSLGFDPRWKVEEVPMMPKARYDIMKKYMPTKGELGLDMMFRSCTIQVNLDFESEKDMVEKMRIGLALQPLATALFANSPFKDGKANGYLSWRQNVWKDTDPDRCGNLPFAFEPGFGFEKYLDYVLDVPMYFVYRDGRYFNCSGQSFRDFLKGNVVCFPDERPTMLDYENHLTTIFPEVRLKQFLEMRGADGGPEEHIVGLSAFWVGLLYDEAAQSDAYALISDWTREERDAIWRDAPKTALKTPFRGKTLRELALQVLAISKGGLQRRGLGEERYLDPLFGIAESGKTLADRHLELFNGVYKGNVEPFYNDLAF